MNKEAFDYAMQRFLKLAAEGEDQEEDDKPKKDDKSDDKPKKDDKGDDKPKKKVSPPPAKDIVGTDTRKGLAADILSPSAFGADRAGRAQSMATAAGQKTPFSTRHPNTNMLGGLALGGGIGAVGGGLLGFGTNALLNSGRNPDGATVLGGSIGAAFGALGGGIHAGGRVNQQIRQIGGAYDQAREAGSLNPTIPRFSEMSTLLSPLGGSHRRGQMGGYNAMVGGPDQRVNELGSRAMNTATHLTPLAELIGPGLSLPMRLGIGAGQARLAKMESDAAMKKLSINWEPLKTLGSQISGGIVDAGASAVNAVKPLAKQVWSALPEGGHARQSLIGAGIGAGVGMLGGGASGLMSRPDAGESRVGNMFSGAATGAIGGGAAGAGIGALTPEWGPHVTPYTDGFLQELSLDNLERTLRSGREGATNLFDRVRSRFPSAAADAAEPGPELNAPAN